IDTLPYGNKTKIDLSPKNTQPSFEAILGNRYINTKNGICYTALNHPFFFTKIRQKVSFSKSLPRQRRGIITRNDILSIIIFDVSCHPERSEGSLFSLNLRI